MCTKNLSCPLCCRSNFPNIDALRISLLKVTSRPLKCPICVDEVLGLDKLTIHLFGHSILGPEDGKPPPPPVEKKKPPTTTSQLKSVRKSRSTQKTQPIEPSRCGICGDEFRDQSLLQMHQSVFHEIPIRPLEEKPPLTFQCTMCPKVFKMKGSLKIHMRVVHLGCPKKAATVTTNGSSAVPPSDPPPAYPSTDVVHWKCFRQRVSYLVHRRIHTNTQPYKCTACEKSFRYKVSQRTHKCPAQPPGTVIRQTGDLLQKLLQSSAILPTLQEQQQPSTASPPPAPPSSVETEQIPDEEDDATRSDDYINRTLDELLKESYDKMGISGDQSQLYAAMDGGSGGSSSSGVGESSVLVPRIENLCLMSPGPRGDLMSFDGESMEVIDSYKLDLLYN
ncbi:hypothetical protein pipiens_002929 [Culex pipiens pipiens]|uniref:C2H2-type domain-containing protein n=1 Tax=Culex pipiens pipiens TaxID=38569 RepID=A0ABD1D5W6_CULPP